MQDYTQGADYLAAKLDYMNSPQHPNFSEEGEGDVVGVIEGEEKAEDHLTEYFDTQKELISSIYEQSDRETTEYIGSMIQSEPEKLVEETRKLERGEEIEVGDFTYTSGFVDLVISEGEN